MSAQWDTATVSACEASPVKVFPDFALERLVEEFRYVAGLNRELIPEDGSLVLPHVYQFTQVRPVGSLEDFGCIHYLVPCLGVDMNNEIIPHIGEKEVIPA